MVLGSGVGWPVTVSEEVEPICTLYIATVLSVLNVP